MDQAAKLRELLSRPGILLAPGCYDGISARLVERGGFEVAYMTGFGSAASVLGMPDTGLISFAEMATHAGNLAAALNIPLIADADTGYGNAVNVHRTVQAYARAGVAGIQLEDQVSPKKCGHTKGKLVVPLPEMLGKIRAAVDARAERDIVIVARTDARAVNGFDDALERSHAFAEAGADVVFFEAPESEAEMERVAKEIKAPTLINVVQDGRTPCLHADVLARMGFKIAIYPSMLFRIAALAIQEELARFQRDKEYTPGDTRMRFSEIQDIVGFPWYYSMEEKYRA
ncbi:MAG TPA: isocitrate lyase/PEP mutase family protein [bacterium]|nr:isocitrate lyase/PEP mutase family protein [bacterium]